MPKFMSAFLSFLSFQTFKAAAVEEAPATLTELSHFDAALFYLTLVQATCVFAVIMEGPTTK